MPCTTTCYECAGGYCCSCGQRVGSIRCRCDLAGSAAKVFVGKKPRSASRHLGIEIEFICEKDPVTIANAFADANLQNYVQLKEDGSVQDSDGENGHELNVLLKERTYKLTLKKVCDVLISLDAEVNSSCGLHVHLDMRARNKERVFHNLVSVQDILFSMQPASRRENAYCPRNICTSFQEEEEKGDRSAINTWAWRDHKTLEVRLHAGTINFNKISNWVDILVTVAKKRSTLPTPVKTVEEFSKVVRLAPYLLDYVSSRIRIHSGLTTAAAQESVGV